MYVKNLIERVNPNFRQTKLALEWIKDGLTEMNLSNRRRTTTQTISLTDGTRAYDLTEGWMRILAVYQLNSNGVYTQMPELRNHESLELD